MDWYEPTVSALNAAEEILCKNAIIICDDYGHHSGVKQATDEWLKDTRRNVDVTMTDYSCARIVLLD
jgi:hypothetical protein